MFMQESPLSLIQEASRTCRELEMLVREENASLLHQSAGKVEERLERKKVLVLRLEKLMQEIRGNGARWKADPSLGSPLRQLAAQLNGMRESARLNAAKLEAAHKLRADLMMTIRDAVDDAMPRARLYSASGAYHQADGATRLIAREV